MRLLPVLFGVATVAALFALTRRLFDARTGLIAAFLLAIAPLHVHHSQDLKEYIYLPFVACLIGIFLHKAIETARASESTRWRDWIAYGLLAGLGCYTEIFVGPLLVGLNLWALAVLTKAPGHWKGWLTGNALGALLFIPWLSIMIRKAIGTMIDAETWWIPPPSPLGVLIYVKSVAFGYAAPPIYTVALAVFALLIVAGFVVAIIRAPRAGWFLACWCLVPVAIVYAISLKTESIFLIRAMLPYAMGLYIVAAVAIAAIPMRAARIATLAVVCVLSAIGLGYEYLRIYPPLDFPHRPGTHPPRDYRVSAEYILDRWQEGDVVVHSAASTWLPFFWYGFREMPQYFGGVGGKFIADIELGNPRNTDDPALDNYWPQEPQVATKGARRVWFVFAEWERKYLEGNATAVWTWLDTHFTEVERTAFLGIDLALYERIENAPVIRRDRDDGVAADVSIAGKLTPYHKVRLDSGLVPTPEAERRGALTLEFHEGVSPSRVGFSVENRFVQQRTVDVFMIASDSLINAASLYEADAGDEVWHVYDQHNPHAPPPNYAVPVASAHFHEPGTGTLLGEVRCPAGTYDTWLFMMGTPGDVRYGRADLALFAGDVDLVAPISKPENAPFQWAWLPGEAVTLTSAPTPIRVIATCPPGREPAYVDLAYIALQRQVSDASPYEPLVMTRVLAPEDVWIHSAELGRAARRVDIWVYERGHHGKAYHIFRIAE
jgi:hypothetical protein